MTAIASFTVNQMTVIMCLKNKFTAIRDTTTGTPAYHHRSLGGISPIQSVFGSEIHARKAADAIVVSINVKITERLSFIQQMGTRADIG